MNFTLEKLKEAREAGIPDDVIWEAAATSEPKFNELKKNNIPLDVAFEAYQQFKPTGTSLTQELQQLGPAFVESLGRPLESMGESFEVLGFQGVADALKGAITEPENYVSAAQRFMEPKEDEAQFLGFAWQYAPRAAVEQAGQAIGSIATRVAGGIAGAPLGPAGVAAGAFVGPAIFEAAQIIGPVAKERAQNNGREVPTNEDILAATVTAAGSGALNAIGAKYLPGGEKATGKFFKRVASSFLGEAATEAPQSIVEQVGTTAGTEAGLNINLKQAIGEGIIGGVTGAGLTGITAPFTKGAEEQVIRTPEQAEEIDIEAKANEEAVSLLGAPADQAKNAQISKVKELEAVIANNEMLEQAFEPNTPEAQRLKMENKVAREEIEKAKVELEQSVGLAPVENTKQVQSRIEQAKVELTGLEPTSRKAKALEAQIAQDEAKVKALSEPIAAAEAEQARLAREIAAPVEEAAPAEPTAEVAAPTVEAAPVVEPVPPTEEAVTPPVEPTAAVEEAPIEPVAEAPAITPAPVAEIPAAIPVEKKFNSLRKSIGAINPLVGDMFGDKVAFTTAKDDDPNKAEVVVTEDIDNPNTVILENIFVPEAGRGKGLGRSAMEMFLAEVDRLGMDVKLEIDPETSVNQRQRGKSAIPMNEDQLRNWYSKFGFQFKYLGSGIGYTTRGFRPSKETLVEQYKQTLPPIPVGTKLNPDNLFGSTSDLLGAFEQGNEQLNKARTKGFYGGPNFNEGETYYVSDGDIFTLENGELKRHRGVAEKNGIVVEQEEVLTTEEKIPRFTPTTAAAPTPTAPAVGNRIKLGKSPQTYTIEEVIPQTEAEKELGEQYYSVRNEKTGEVQTVEAKDLKPVKAKGVRKMAARTRNEEYMRLAQDPEANREQLQRMVDEAAKAAGYNIGPVPHGTTSGQFNEFRTPAYFGSGASMYAQADSEIVSWKGKRDTVSSIKPEEIEDFLDTATGPRGFDFDELYAGKANGRFVSFGGDGIYRFDGLNEYGDFKYTLIENLTPIRDDSFNIVDVVKAPPQTEFPRIIKAYLKLENPAILGASEGSRLAKGKNGNWDQALYDRLVAAGNDGAIADDDWGGPWNKHYIAFSPNQIKSADPVTYDDAGNIIPLEERFQPTSPDIRREAATRVKDESLVVPEADRYTFEQAEAEARKLFGGMPEGFVIVNDSVDPEYEFKAGYEPETGDIILNLAYIRKGENVRNLIAHELGHYAAGDPEIRAKLQEFLDAMPPATRAKLERFVERVYNDETGDVRLEEKQVRAFVQMLKAGDQRNAFQKILDAIKMWLNDNLGTNFQPTDMDAAAILSGAINRFNAGEFIAREEEGMREAKVERSEDVKKDIAIAEKIQSVVNDTISKMPQDQGRDYNAFVNEGKSEAQIAEENNTSVSQVRTNIIRGKKAVGDAIKKAKIDTKAKPDNAVLEWTTGAVKKYFTKEGDLPFGTFQNWVRRNAKLAREAEESRQATQDFYEGLRKLYKINKIKFILDGLSSIPPEDVARFNDALAGEIPISDMPTEIQEPLTRMRQHIDAMSSELIATGQLPEYLEAKAMNNLGVYLTRSYKIFSDPKWINKIPQEKLTAARNFLYQQQSKTDPNFTIEDADRKLEQMLNDWAGEKDMEGKRGGRLGAKDLSVMMTRSEVPKQLRDVMGENTNVIFNYANTIAKISRFVADQQFLDAVKKEGAGKFLFTKDAAPKGFNTLIAPEESRTMAPLSGLRTTPEIAKAFEEFGKAYDAKANPFLYAFGWLNAVGKANLTVGSLFTQARNIIGQPFFFLANGHADLRAINREVERIMKSKGLSKDKARNELVKMAAGEGLVNENAYAGELKEAFEQIGLKTFEDMDADEFSRQFVLLRLFKKGTQGAQKVYQKTDELGKLIGWLNETNRIQKMNPGMSREDAMSIASERTRNTYPTYSQGSEALRLFRRQPFFGPFATFFYETFRTTYWNVVYAFQDINSGTEAGKQEGIKRLAGTMAQIAIGAYLVNAISAMVSGIGDQEEEDVRRMLPPWAANASLVWFPKTKDGVYDFINFSSLNPYNALSDPFVTMISGFSRGEDPTDIFIESAGTFLSPFTSEQPVTAATIDALRNVTERGTKVYNEEDDLGTKTSKILLHIFGKAFTPGTIDRLRKRIIPAIYGETVGTRAPAPLKEISAEFTGVRFENLDMRQAFQNKAWEFNKAQNDSERIFRDVATRRRRVTEEEQIDAYRRAEESRYQNWQDMYRNYMALRRAGASKQEAVRLMTDIKISKREASYIARGKYVPYEVSDEVRRRSKLNGNVVPLQEIKAIAREMPRVLEDVK